MATAFLLLAVPIGRMSSAATHVLAAGGGNWSSAASWASGGIPTSGEMGGTIVQIPGSTTSTDDIAGLVVDLLDFTGSGAILNGGPSVTLGISGLALLTNLQAAGTTQINPSLPIVLSGNNCGVTVTAGTLSIYSNISGSQGLYKLGGTGDLALGHSNSYTGKTIVTIGTLRLTGAIANATIPGDLEVGDGAGAAYSAVLAINSALEQIADTSNVKIYSDGWFLLPASLPLERFGSLTMTGGLLQTDPANSVAPGNVTATSTAAGPAQIAATVSIAGGALTNFSVADGPAADDLVLNRPIVESA
ncbi:MAG TPA: hypothetical protein VGR00_13270, partial [Thermoanaerobaculia bacterium]|nr:hypothetical protein [Thermoanaerobaculia bacterium]